MFGVVLTGSRTKTLPIAVFNFMAYSEINWGGLMAAAGHYTAGHCDRSVYTEVHYSRTYSRAVKS